MILIADSGSTKTEWRILKPDGEIIQVRSGGINPYYQDSETIKSSLSQGLNDYLNLKISQIYFYGAGCSSDHNKAKMRDCFASIYPKAAAEVDIDLVAAARALCGHTPGIACILGTGANSCLYNGEHIIENVPSLGYLLGDEGSGSYMGNKLLGAFMRQELPDAIYDRLRKRFDLSNEAILESVYQKEMPIKYIASFSKFIFQNIKDPYLYELVSNGFKLFFEKNIMRYTDWQNQPVHFTGSVAFYYSNILRQVSNDLGITIRHIVEGPIAGLALYHQQELKG